VYGGPCPWDSTINGFTFDAPITPTVLQAWGLTGAQLRSMLDAGNVYINVHTSLNPAGEARGQFSLN
jgi:hypothetical protein